MCGIVGFTGARPAAPYLLDGLQKLEYRGYDSAGVSVIENGAIRTVKTKGRLRELRAKLLDQAELTGVTGIGHTRWATHGAPSDLNAHPHMSMDGSVSVVHNGIIENYLSLKAELEAEGVRFVSETDTEVLAHLFAKFYTGDMVAALRQVMAKIRGSYALAFLCADQPNQIVAVRKDSPLLVGLGEGENYLASDIPAALEYTRCYYLLNDNEIVVLRPEKVTLLDQDDREIDREVYEVTWDMSAAEKGGFDTFMRKEIAEQPRAVRDCLSGRLNGDTVTLDLSLSESEIRSLERIRIVACGSAWHAGLVGKYVIEALTRIPVEVDLASEFRYRDPILRPHELLVTISQSGETADTIAALRLARSSGMHVLSIVNAVGSSIARESDDVIYTVAGPEIAVATTKGYTTQLIALYLLAMRFAQVRATADKDRLRRLAACLRALPEQVEETIGLDEVLTGLAKSVCAGEHLFVLGRGIDYAASMEGSLKLKEISYIHSEAYAAGELKHGTISLIEKGTPVVALCTQPALEEKVLSNIKEVKARGAHVLVIADKACADVASVADEVVYLPHTDPLFTSTLSVIPMQLLAYHTALQRGCDVDKPRNLAKSVTVE